MNIIVPEGQLFNGETERALRSFVVALDGLPAPRHMEAGLVTFGRADQVCRMAVDALQLQMRPERDDIIDLTPKQVCEAAITTLRNYGLRVGPFRKRKIARLIELEEPFEL